MSETIYLEPEKVTELEPFEGPPRNLSMLSPFAVPTAVEINVDDAEHLTTIRFDYIGGETGDEVTPLDGENNPAVQVLAARHTRKILELRFFPAIGAPTPDSIAMIMRVADRVEVRSRTIATAAGRLSYLLTARIIKKWASRIMQRIASEGSLP